MSFRNSNERYVLIVVYVIVFLTLGQAQETKLTKDSECYTANGVDYIGKQGTTYVKGNERYEPAEPGFEVCLPWKDNNASTLLPENYCRNPNNRLFPWCFVMRNGSPRKAYCHIPTCYTPALLGCYKVVVKHADNPDSNDDLILDGDDRMTEEEDMKIARCLNFCRSRKYDFAGLTSGDTCMCGTRDKDGEQLKDELNLLHPHDCFNNSCTGDKMQACGSDTAIAIYDVEAGACEGTFHDRDTGVIYSPRWPGNYDNNLMCGWTIYVPGKFRKTKEIEKRHVLRLSFPYFNTENTNDTIKIYAYMNDTDANPVNIGSYSGVVKPANITKAISEVFALHIVFKSDKEGKHDGFIIRYEIIDTNPPATTTLPDVVVTNAPVTTSTRRTTTLPTPTPSTTKSTTTPTTTPKATSGSKTPAKVLGLTPTTQPNVNASATTPVKADAPTSDPNAGGKIAGIVLGVLLLIVLIVIGVIIFIKYRNGKGKDEEGNPSPPAMFDNPVRFETDSTL